MYVLTATPTACGSEIVSTLQQSTQHWQGKSTCIRIKQDYRDATAFINEELGRGSYITAATIQAITWVTHKRIHNV